jgi:hypothetical protein
MKNKSDASDVPQSRLDYYSLKGHCFNYRTPVDKNTAPAGTMGNRAQLLAASKATKPLF